MVKFILSSMWQAGTPCTTDTGDVQEVPMQKQMDQENFVNNSSCTIIMFHKPKSVK